MTLSDLKRELRLTDKQLDATVEDSDLPELAGCFENTEDYVEKLGLTPGQQTDVRTQAFVNCIQTGMKLALKYWKKGNPYKATYRGLLLIPLSLKKGDVAVRVCKCLTNKGNLAVCMISEYKYLNKLSLSTTCCTASDYIVMLYCLILPCR